VTADVRWRSVDEPWARPAGEVARDLGVDPARGLGREECASRRRRAGPNELHEAPAVPWWRRFFAELLDPLVLLLVAAVVVSLVVWAVDGAVGVPFDAVVIGVIVALNAALGLGQESKAERAVAALQRMASVSATVVRDGAKQRVKVRDVVPGDVMLVAEGDAVAADGRVLDAASLRVSEASLTGESVPVLKSPHAVGRDATPADRTSMVHSGSAVVSGRGRVVVTATGMDTQVGAVARLLDSTRQPRTPLQREVDLIGRVLLRAVLAIAVVVVAAVLLTSDIRTAGDVVDVLLLGISLAVAAVPEGLPAILAVVLALGVQRMARQQAIVKRLSSVETLGSASVICSDKTGTLTRGEMTLLAVVTGSGRADVTGTGYQSGGEVLVDDVVLDDAGGPLADEVRRVLLAGAVANDAELVVRQDGVRVPSGDPTEVAILVAAHKLPGVLASGARLGELPFTAERKLMSAVVRPDGDAHGGGPVLFAKGAPDVLVQRCSHEQVAGVVQPLAADGRDRLMRQVGDLADQGLRTLAMAYRHVGEGTWGAEEVAYAEHDLVYLGLVGIMDPPRDEAAGALREAQSAGVRVLMITGDHPGTAVRVATDLNIGTPPLEVLTGQQIDDLDDARLRERVREVSVYARVAPEHKLRIVTALQADGEVVAVTGDGVNDAPALRAADIGVAMGLAGTEVSKAAADMVLADDNVATIVAAVREGRGVFSDIRAFLRYLLSSNAGEVLTMLLGVLGAGVLGLAGHGEAVAVPLLATQILWINLLTDTAPALAMGVDPPPDDVMRRPPRRLTDRVIDREMLTGVVVVGLVMALATLLALDLTLPGGLVPGHGTIVQARTMAFTTLVLAQLFNCLNSRSDRTSAFYRLFTNGWLWAAIALSAGLQVAVVHTPWLSAAFGTSPLSAGQWGLCAALASGVLWADELRKLVVRARRGGRPAA
jgi:magnesium-transporting ATPase (P-type)